MPPVIGISFTEIDAISGSKGSWLSSPFLRRVIRSLYGYDQIMIGTWRRAIVCVFCFLGTGISYTRAPSAETLGSAELLETYSRAISLVDAEYANEVLFLLKPESVRQSHLDLLGEVLFVSSELTSDTARSTTLPIRLNEYLVPQVWNYLKKQHLHPTEDDVIRYRNNHPDAYSTRAWIIGSRILVRNDSPTSETDIMSVQNKLKDRDQDFRVVAREFYRSQGEDKDGSFGRVEKGDIAEELFEIFFKQNPREPYFGPLKTHHGFIFGQLQDRGMEGYRPLGEIRRRIEQRVAQERFQDFSTRFFEQLEAKGQKVVRNWRPADKAPAPGEVVYVLDGEHVTYKQVLDDLVGVYGDHSSFKFFESVTNSHIRNKLLLMSEEADVVRRSAEFQFLFQALLAHERYNLLLKQQLAPGDQNAPPDEEVLKAFYNQKKEELFAKQDEVKFLAIALPMFPRPDVPPHERESDRAKAWTMAKGVQASIAATDEPFQYPVNTIPAEMRPRRFITDEWTPLDQLPKEYAEQLTQLKAGATSPVTILNETYVVFCLIARRPGGYIAFDAARDKLLLHYKWEQLVQARSNLVKHAQQQARERQPG